LLYRTSFSNEKCSGFSHLALMASGQALVSNGSSSEAVWAALWEEIATALRQFGPDKPDATSPAAATTAFNQPI